MLRISESKGSDNIMLVKSLFTDTKSTWINVNSDNAREVTKIFKDYNIAGEMLTYALDKNERAHVEYDSGTNTFFIVYGVPIQKKVDNQYRSAPMTFMIKDNTLITVSSDDTQYIVNKMSRYLELHDTITLYKFLFVALYIASESYFPQVEYMQMATRNISAALRDKANKTNLLHLSDLEIGSVYLISATKQNVVLLEQIRANLIYRHFDSDEKEQFEDALIEAKQLVEMVQLNSQILAQLSQTYNNILNTNLNDTMKFMAIYALIMEIPAAVTGFFGMNVDIPWTNLPFAWVHIIVMTAGLCMILLYFINKYFK